MAEAAIYVAQFIYEKNVDVTTANVMLSNDSLQSGISINPQFAAEIIKAIADAGHLEVEIIDVQKY